MPTATIATAADYADAMMAARRAKNWLYLLLLFVLVGQLAIFFLVRFKVISLPTAAIAATQPADAAATQPSPRPSLGLRMAQYLVALSDLLGIVFVIVLCVVLLLIVNIMLVGRLIGVSLVTGAFIWCVVLAVLLFPWQVFRNETDPPTDADESVVDFKLPGVLYTWRELTQDATVDWKFTGERWDRDVLKWARFAGFPIFALVLLLNVHVKSNRGLRVALGEAELDQTEPPEPPAT